MPQLEHIEAIERRLWNSADTLRANSNYASNEYFMPVMGLIFLRHAYNRFLAVQETFTVMSFASILRAHRRITRLWQPEFCPTVSMWAELGVRQVLLRILSTYHI